MKDWRSILSVVRSIGDVHQVAFERNRYISLIDQKAFCNREASAF